MDEAIKLLEETVERRREVEGPQDEQTMSIADGFWRSPTPARGNWIAPPHCWMKSCRAGRSQRDPTTPYTLETMILLGDVQVQRTNTPPPSHCCWRLIKALPNARLPVPRRTMRNNFRRRWRPCAAL